MKKSRVDKILDIPDEIIFKLKGESGRNQLVTWIKQLDFAYKRRIQSFKRNDVDSYAQIQYEALIPSTRKDRPLERMTRNQLLYEFFNLTGFFRSETSTLAGIRRVNREQDIRIFGVDARGNPLKKMTTDERREYWKFYDEYKRTNQGDLNQLFSSESIQQFIADAVFEDGHEPDFNTDDVVAILRRARQRLIADKAMQDEEEFIPGVLSGRGTAFNWGTTKKRK